VKRHRFDPVSFVWGLLFAGFGLATLSGTIRPSLLGLRAFWPLTIVALGLAILSSLRPGPRTEEEEPSLHGTSSD
jgi:hypothetical protein